MQQPLKQIYVQLCKLKCGFYIRDIIVSPSQQIEFYLFFRYEKSVCFSKYNKYFSVKKKINPASQELNGG